MHKSHQSTISRRNAMRLFGGAASLFGGAAGAILSVGGAAAAAASPGAAAIVPRHAARRSGNALANLAVADFEQLVGERFAVGRHQVTLRRVRRGRPSGSGFREQFALVFSVPRTLPIGSEILPVSHPAVGRHDLLVTQTADAVSGTVLEICFS